jgi:hypothetical protein
MSNSFKPHFNGPTLSVVRPKQLHAYELYNEADIDAFNRSIKLNAQIDELKLENATLKLDNEQLLRCCKVQGAGSRRFRKHMRVRKGTASRRRHKNRK